MSGRKGGLQKNVQNIFEDATLPDDMYAGPASEEQPPTPSAAVAAPEEECAAEVNLDPPESDVVTESAVTEEPAAAPATAEVEPEAQLATETEPDQGEIEPAIEPTIAEPAHAPDQSPERPEFYDRMIEGQMKKQRCEKGFSCYVSGLKDLCKARVIRKGKAVQCLEPKKRPCEYRISTLFKRFCQCPIRIHIAKKHKK